MVVFTLALMGAAALITGVGTYFAVRQSASNVNSGATAEIRNDVNIEENIDRGSDLLSIIGIIFISIIALVKIIELGIYFMNRCKQSMKKKYEKRASSIPLATMPSAASATSNSNV